LFIELCFSHFLDLFQHIFHVRVEAGLDVGAALVGRLDEEPSANDIALDAVARPDNVAELLDGPQLIESWFVQELESNLVEQLGARIFAFDVELVVRHQH
jgi:hypothetical protein